MNDAAVLLPAAGRGRRLGEAKQFLELGGVPMLALAARAASSCPQVAALIVAAPPGDEERVRALLIQHQAAGKLLAVVAGGQERAGSVQNALHAVPPGIELVAVHDAARPFATPGLFTRVLAEAREHGAAIAALPCSDTVKRGSQTVSATLDRRELWLAQTPQCFRVSLLRAAYEKAGDRASSLTDEAQLVEALGGEVRLVPGEKENFKVTDADDLARARARALMPAAVGHGLDVHGFGPGRRCMLGGVEFPGEEGLVGHSDADAPLHALMDAILGASGLGDIGQHFPDSDDTFRGADSSRLLSEVVRLAREAGFVPINADLTIAAARPKIAPRRDAMRARIAELLGLPIDRVNVKATTTEGLGFVGRSEGIAAQAVVLMGRA